MTKARRIQFMAFGVTDASFTDLDEDTDILDYLESLGFQVVKHFVIGNQSAAIERQKAERFPIDESKLRREFDDD